MTTDKDRYIEDLKNENARLKDIISELGQAEPVLGISASGERVMIGKDYYVELLEDKISLMQILDAMGKEGAI